MTVNLTGVADMQTLVVTLTGVTDSSAQVLPDTQVPLKLLVGDVNGNKTVSASDLGQVKSLSGATVDAANFRTDVNVSGTLTGSDISLVKASAGHTVP